MITTKKRSKGRRRHRFTHLAGAKKGRKNGWKRKNKNGGTRTSQQQQQQQPTKVLKQSNLDGIIVESLDVEGFGDSFQPM